MGQPTYFALATEKRTTTTNTNRIQECYGGRCVFTHTHTHNTHPKTRLALNVPGGWRVKINVIVTPWGVEFKLGDVAVSHSSVLPGVRHGTLDGALRVRVR
jgi:hypothetical protein